MLALGILLLARPGEMRLLLARNRSKSL